MSAVQNSVLCSRIPWFLASATRKFRCRARARMRAKAKISQSGPAARCSADGSYPKRGEISFPATARRVKQHKINNALISEMDCTSIRTVHTEDSGEAANCTVLQLPVH